VFAKITGITVHSLQEEHDAMESVVHYLPVGMDWETSLVIRFTNGNHFQCVVPLNLPTELVVTDKKCSEPKLTLELSSDDDIGWSEVKKRRKERMPKRPSQKERKKDLKCQDTVPLTKYQKYPAKYQKCKDTVPPAKNKEQWDTIPPAKDHKCQDSKAQQVIKGRV
jgi:hypothetical protein